MFQISHACLYPICKHPTLRQDPLFGKHLPYPFYQKIPSSSSDVDLSSQVIAPSPAKVQLYEESF